MKQFSLSALLILLIASCGDSNEDYPTYHFTNSDLYPIFGHEATDGLAWSPDGHMIALVHKRDLWWISPNGGKATQLTDLEGTVSFPDWDSVNGIDKLVFINSFFGEVDPETGWRLLNYEIRTLIPESNELNIIKSFPTRLRDPSWSYDGEKIIFLKDRDQIALSPVDIFNISVDGGEATIIPSEQLARSLQASPVGDELFYIAEGANVYRLITKNIETNLSRVIKVFPKDKYSSIGDIDISADGSQIIYVAHSEETNSSNLYMIPTEGGDEVMLTEFPNPETVLYNPAWSPDGKKIAVILSRRNPITAPFANWRFAVYIAELKF
jgi:Tol biopolymer transport system component